MTSLSSDHHPVLPADLEAIFTANKDSPLTLLESFMPVFCNHVKADRIFLQPRNPDTRVCRVLRWRRSEEIPWPAIPNKGKVIDGWFVEDKWEVEDPLWRAALQLKPSIYITSLSLAASQGLLNLEFENKYMFHTAFIHGHAHWPPISDEGITERKFYGSVQPAVFDGDRDWTVEVRELVEKCLIRITPIMKVIGEAAPGLGEFGVGV